MIFPTNDIQIFNLPKAGSTSIKVWHAREIKLWCARRNADLTNEKIEDDVHKIFPNLPFELAESSFEENNQATKVALVRDPLQRLLSVYGNRILYHQDLKRIEPKKLLSRARFYLNNPGFKTHPSADHFFSNLDFYQNVSPGILYHTRSCKHFLGSDLGYFDHVFQLEDISKLEDFLSVRMNKPVKFPREQTGGPKTKLHELQSKTISRILERLEEDYIFLQKFYKMPKHP